MLFLLFQLGQDRYALDTRRVVEVLPLIELKKLPNAPPAVAGLFNYRGQPVTAIDLCMLTLGRPASRRLSTRLIVMDLQDAAGGNHRVALIAEQATEVMRKDDKEFVATGVKVGGAPFLGPVLLEGDRPVQWIHEEGLVTEPLRRLLFSSPAEITDAGV